ncbi:MAG: LuxR family transcriptional regulator [Ilumatobacteraceae bacterium]|nr:LuxR family transcriptional regulator [Ilumatobacteraceae bacterium]
MIGAGGVRWQGRWPLLAVSAGVVLVTAGFAQGVWLANLHNGLLGVAFTFVGAYVLFQRPRHREGALFLATGLVESLMFLGRQIGHSSSAAAARWWGWLGVWPLVVSLALTTFSVMCFPDGRLPSSRWRPVATAIVVVTFVCAALSAGWPVEYGSAGVNAAHPINAIAPSLVKTIWSALAHPAYIGFQVLWVAAIVARWRRSVGPVRRQLTWLMSASGLSLALLVTGLVVLGTPRWGVLSVALVPVAAGWAIVHGQQVAAYSALTWLSRSTPRSADLPSDLTRATCEALLADSATLWIGSPTALHPVGIWPRTATASGQTSLTELQSQPDRPHRVIATDDTICGAISIDRPASNPMSRAEGRLFDDLAAQAALVLEHVNLSNMIAQQRRTGALDGLRPREQQVLELMSRGLSNAAICEELHLSIKTVEPIVSGIFNKLDLYADATSNRRVLAVLAYLRA